MKIVDYLHRVGTTRNGIVKYRRRRGRRCPSRLDDPGDITVVNVRDLAFARQSWIAEYWEAAPPRGVLEATGSAPEFIKVTIETA